jgi:hypothetical protein
VNKKKDNNIDKVYLPDKNKEFNSKMCLILLLFKTETLVNNIKKRLKVIIIYINKNKKDILKLSKVPKLKESNK